MGLLNVKDRNIVKEAMNGKNKKKYLKKYELFS